MRLQKIPVMAIAGFLGAGKTTLLNHILKTNHGLKIGVIINDFGQINIDSLLVAGQTDSKIELSNGCVCCVAEESGLSDAIADLAERTDKLDMIIIETSGLADPLAVKVQLQRLKHNKIYFDSLVEVVDALNFEQTAQQHPEFKDQLASADLLVLNKVDLITAEHKQQLRQLIQFLDEHLPIVETVNGQLDARILLNQDQYADMKNDNQLSLAHELGDHTDHAHEKYSSMTFSTDKPLDPKHFQQWLNQVPSEIFRIKGFCYFGAKGAEQKYLLQFVGSRWELKLDEWSTDETRKTNLVVIGLGFDEKQTELSLKSCIDPNPEDVSEETMMDIFSYR